MASDVHAGMRMSGSSSHMPVRSILLSGNKPPSVHEPPPPELEPTRGGEEPDLRADEAQRIRAAQIAGDSSPDVRPPSIHLSEYAYVEAAAAATLAALSAPSPVSPTSPDQPNTPATPMPVPVAVRTRRNTLDLPGSPYDDRKLSPEIATSPKPCIVPGNALHLVDDDPAAPRSATPPSLIVVGDESEYGAEPDSSDADADHEGEGGIDGAGAETQTRIRPAPRVRFRSRVRITSGVHRHRHSVAGGGGSATPGSTTSESPSSSISAPLRYQADDDTTWGPIGKRLSGYAWQRRMQAQAQMQGMGVGAGQQGAVAQGYGGTRNGTMTRNGMRSVSGRGQARGERTPLLRAHLQRAYGEDEDDDESRRRISQEERALRAAALRREEEVVFGRWPWRIFNRHWWWWHVEPVLCCCCAEDSDYDEF